MLFRVLLVAAALGLGAAAPKSEAIAPVRQIYSGKVLPDQQVQTFRNIDKLFPTRVVKAGPKARPLPPHTRQISDVSFKSGDKPYDLYDYVSHNRVTGLLVLKNGRTALELYQGGNDAKTRWMSMSMVKSISSTLVGAAIRDGHIRSVDDQIVTYLPELKGSGYDGVTIRQVLHMASGVRWNETYTDPTSDRRRMLDAQIAQQPGGVMKLLSGLPRAHPPGTRWNYSTGETHIVGALIRAATKRPVAQYLSEKIWTKAGMESDATWWLDAPNGLEVGGSGLSATLRDYGRFGLFFLENGAVGGEQVLPAGWRDDASASQTLQGRTVDYGYMWWPLGAKAAPVHAGAFEAVGIFGQHIYINPRENVVIVVWSARSKPDEDPLVADADFFGAVVEALR
jgi:CubicO group peptidase (beta-lactamase class C family)